MKAQIIATLGPASSHPDLWAQMLAAGASGFRLNTSHMDIDQLEQWLERLAGFQAKSGQEFSLVIDLQGSKWRLGSVETRELTAGQTITLVLAEISPPGNALPVPHADFFAAAPGSSGEVVLNDAKVRLRLISTSPDWATALVTQGGPLTSRKGITYTHSEHRIEQLSAKDRAILDLAGRHPSVQIAVSYVRDATEMAAYRRLLGNAYAIAKLERGPAVEVVERLAEQANEIWVCRGDLGAELGLNGMAQAVAAVTARLRTITVPVLMAGQVLEHMAAHPTPTRSEVCYIYDALAAGYGGVVLSDETAIGKYPLECVRAAVIMEPV